MMPSIDLHKSADVIFGIIQKPFYIISSNLVSSNCFGLFSEIKKGLGLAFGAHFLHDFFIKMFCI